MTSLDAGGRRFPVGGGTFSMMEVAAVLRSGLPDRAGKLPKVELPDWFVRLYATVDKELKSNLCELGYHRTADSTDAQALLGRSFIPDDQTIIDTGRSMVAQQLV
jgi:dihydroflavonol-4-reductase